ncbi:MAG: thioredoxin [Clostridiaceae bacterium]|jgi:thioredoxin 1|nr:thioredoxin [Clostridiaceae bacterium]NLW54623.1 thioredoxin [Clostridiaceae bacterium]
MTLTLTKANFKEEVLENEQPVLVDFWASWCGPCRMVGPIVEALADDFDGRAGVGKVNVDEEDDLARQYSIMSIPTLVIFKGGEVVERVVGARSQGELAALLEKHI